MSGTSGIRSGLWAYNMALASHPATSERRSKERRKTPTTISEAAIFLSKFYINGNTKKDTKSSASASKEHLNPGSNASTVPRRVNVIKSRLGTSDHRHGAASIANAVLKDQYDDNRVSQTPRIRFNTEHHDGASHKFGNE